MVNPLYLLKEAMVTGTARLRFYALMHLVREAANQTAIHSPVWSPSEVYLSELAADTFDAVLFPAHLAAKTVVSNLEDAFRIERAGPHYVLSFMLQNLPVYGQWDVRSSGSAYFCDVTGKKSEPMPSYMGVKNGAAYLVKGLLDDIDDNTLILFRTRQPVIVTTPPRVVGRRPHEPLRPRD